MTSQLNRSAHRGPGWPLLVVLGVGVILLGVALFAIANPFSDSGNASDTRYTEAAVGAPARVNPLYAYESDIDRDLSSLVFSGLVRLDADGTPKPDLAETWDISADGLTVTFHLRSGVTWHTGEPFTSADVVFTYGILHDPAFQGDPEQASLWRSITCTAANDLTVACKLPEPYAPFLAYASIGILPKTILQTVTPQSLLNDPFNKAPIGTGPYSLASINSSQAVLKANPRFYLGSPNIDEIDIRFHPDMASAAADIIRGQADGLLADLTTDPEDYNLLQDVDGLSPHVATRSAFTILYLNNTAAPLDDVAVRTAIAQAIDVDAIITSLLGGRGQRADTPIAPGTWAFDSDAHQPPHDVGAARRSLELAGWSVSGNNGVRSKYGTELRFSLVTDQDPLRGAVADAIAQHLGEVGIVATVVRESPSNLVRDYLIPRQYQAAIFGWDPGADPDPYPAWHSSQTENGGRNIAGYASDDADKLMEEARRSFKLEDRRDLYHQFQQRFLQDIPSVPLYVPLETYFVSKRVTGIDPGVLFTPASRFRNVWEWKVEEPSGIGGQ